MEMVISPAKTPLKVEIVEFDLEGRNQAGGYGETWVPKWRKEVVSTLLACRTISILMKGSKPKIIQKNIPPKM